MFLWTYDQLKSKLISTKTKIRLYKICSPLQAWMLETEQIFKRIILRKIYGAIKQNNILRITYNHEIYTKYGEPDIVK